MKPIQLSREVLNRLDVIESELERDGVSHLSIKHYKSLIKTLLEVSYLDGMISENNLTKKESNVALNS